MYRKTLKPGKIPANTIRGLNFKRNPRKRGAGLPTMSSCGTGFALEKFHTKEAGYYN
jgi:hypothetical protein